MVLCLPGEGLPHPLPFSTDMMPIDDGGTAVWGRDTQRRVRHEMRSVKTTVVTLLAFSPHWPSYAMPTAWACIRE